MLRRQQQTNPLATTWVDLELHLAGINPASIGMDNVDYDNIPLSQLSTGMNHLVGETSTAKKIKDGLKAVTAKRKKDHTNTGTITDNRRDFARKNFVENWKGFLDDSKVTDDDLDWLCEGLDSLFAAGRDRINKCHGSAGGGVGKWRCLVMKEQVSVVR